MVHITQGTGRKIHVFHLIEMIQQRVHRQRPGGQVGFDDWQIATPNGVTSDAVCKRCGKSRAFLNYSQRKMMVRSVKSNGNNGNNAANSNGNNSNGKKSR